MILFFTRQCNVSTLDCVLPVVTLLPLSNMSVFVIFLKINTTDVAKMVSKAWKILSVEERKKWEELALDDKKRFEAEKSAYKGPWKVPAISSNSKDPTVPKRPMSAFLAFSNHKRKVVRQEHQHLTNADVTRLLGRMWKNLPSEERRVYQDEEARMRERYKAALAGWKKEKQAEFMAHQEVKSKQKRKAGKASKVKKTLSIKRREGSLGSTGGDNNIVNPGRAQNDALTASPRILHAKEGQKSTFGTRMAAVTFGHTLTISPPSSHGHSGGKSSTTMLIESPTSPVTNNGNYRSGQRWGDWGHQEQRQDVSTGDRMNLPPIEGPVYFPNHSMTAMTDHAHHYMNEMNGYPYYYDTEYHEGSFSMPSTPTYPSEYYAHGEVMHGEYYEYDSHRYSDRWNNPEGQITLHHDGRGKDIPASSNAECISHNVFS